MASCQILAPECSRMQIYGHNTVSDTNVVDITFIDVYGRAIQKIEDVVIDGGDTVEIIFQDVPGFSTELIING